jgi:peptide subunit release factor 1 (eRF1)
MHNVSCAVFVQSAVMLFLRLTAAPGPDVVERAIARVSRKGTKVDIVRGEAATSLRNAGGIGAFLRTRTGNHGGLYESEKSSIPKNLSPLTQERRPTRQTAELPAGAKNILSRGNGKRAVTSASSRIPSPSASSGWWSEVFRGRSASMKVLIGYDGLIMPTSQSMI